MPGPSGFEILEALKRKRPGQAVIILSARGEENDRVRGLVNGADDYVVKPFSMKELLARVDAVLRRTCERAAPADSRAIPGGTVDFRERVLDFNDGRREELSEREGDLLRYLLDSQGRIVSREEILRNLWGLDPDRTETRTIDMHIMHLRDETRRQGTIPANHRARQGLPLDRMKIPRTLLIWSALVFCAATILAAMTWQTQRALASERDRIAAVARADLQEKMRLALWRMDTLGAALIVEETNNKSLAQVRARFNWTEGNRQDLSKELQPLLAPAEFRKIFTSLDHGADNWKAPPAPAQGVTMSPQRDSEVAQKSASNVELQKRSQAFDNVYQQNTIKSSNLGELTLAFPNDTPPRPVWIRDQLFLLKPVSRPVRAISGAWIDFPALRARLLAEASDLLPAANLLPAEAPTDDGLVLASFPLRLDPGTLPARDAGIFRTCHVVVGRRMDRRGHRHRGGGPARPRRDAAQRAARFVRLRRHPRAPHAAHHLPALLGHAGKRRGETGEAR